MAFAGCSFGKHIVPRVSIPGPYSTPDPSRGRRFVRGFEPRTVAGVPNMDDPWRVVPPCFWYCHHPKCASSSCKFDAHVETKISLLFSDKTILIRFMIRYFLKQIFGVVCFLYGFWQGSTKLKHHVLPWAEEMRSWFLVRTRMCCSGCSMIKISTHWLVWKGLGGGGRACNKCGPRIERLRQSGTYMISVNPPWHVWRVPCPAVVCCCDDWEVSFNVIFLWFCGVQVENGKWDVSGLPMEISWLRHTRASIARVSVGEPQCLWQLYSVGVCPKAHWVDMPKMPKDETIKGTIEIIPRIKPTELLQTVYTSLYCL